MSRSDRINDQAFDAVEVLVDCPGAQDLYTYKIPSNLKVESGDILNVPFGKRQLSAIAVRLISTVTGPHQSGQLREITDILSKGFFPADYWQLLRQVAHYYQTPLIQVVRTALPSGLLGRAQRRIRLTAAGLSAPSHGLSPTAQTILKMLVQAPEGSYTWRYLQRQQPGASPALRELLHGGWAESYLTTPAPPRPQKRQRVRLTTVPEPEGSAPLTPRQQEIIDILKGCGGSLWLSDALQRLHTTSPTLQRLEKKGVLEILAQEQLRVGSHSQASPDRAKTLTADQRQVLAEINSLEGAEEVLLHGVTGSGKTEVYLQAIAPRLSRGQSALVLVPEIGLTPQLTDRFRARFGEQVCIYHSGLSAGERYDTWRRMSESIPQIVIGTRSAVFSPLPRLGIIVLDEEHDSSFKQDQPEPCYHARTVARWRAQASDCPLLLGSATPALETWQQVQTEKHRGLYLTLPQRIHQQPPPPVRVIDMRQELQAGNRSIFSRTLQTALEQMQQKGNQGILFIHRRGHSRFVSCRSCGHVMSCPNCDVSLAYHRPQAEGRAHLRCHYCGYGQVHPDICPACESPYLKYFGSGTQRVVQELAKQLPGLRCLRFDSDTTQAKGAHRALLQRFAAGEADVLVGTQMLTKGIDLPKITVVGIVAADGLLHMPDYWAAERAFQTLTQVSGRAGRGTEPGQVFLQTYTPEHPVIEAVQNHSYSKFITQEEPHRLLLGYPPYGRLVLLRLSSLEAAAAETGATLCVQHLRRLLPDIVETDDLGAAAILGPTPAPILRVAQRYRWQILIKLAPGDTLPDLRPLRAYLPKSVRLTIDIDPLNMS